MTIVAATFHATYPPYVAGDVAGIGRDLALRLRARGIVTFTDPGSAPNLDRLDRAGLVALAQERLGLDGEPPEAVGDHDLRAALRAALGGMGTPVVLPPGEAAPGWDRLDVMDRLHLEAFARDKVGMAEIDPEMDDAELRRQIRAAAAATLSAAATAPSPPGGPKRPRR